MAACLVGESGNKFNVYSYIYNRNECHLFLRSRVLTVFTVHDTRGGFLFACLLFLISTWEVAVYNRRGCINVVLQRCMQNLMRQILSKYPFPDPRFRTSILSELRFLSLLGIRQFGQRSLALPFSSRTTQST